MKLILLVATWNPPYEDGSVQEDIGIFSSKELAEQQWRVCTRDDESVDSIRFSTAVPEYLEFELNKLAYT